MCLGCSVSLFVIVIIAAMICSWWLVVVQLFYIARMELPPLTINFTPKSLKKGSSLFIFAMQKSARMKLREILKRNTTPTQLKWADKLIWYLFRY